MLTAANPNDQLGNKSAMAFSPFNTPLQQITITQKQPSLLSSVTSARSSEGNQQVTPQTIQNTQQSTLQTVQQQLQSPTPAIPSQIKQISPQTPSMKPEPYKQTLKKNGKHLILDLDETLVHTFGPTDNFIEILEKLTEEQKRRMYTIQFPEGDILFGYVRPYAEEFLKVAFAEFESVAVWSAGTNYYVHRIVEIVFKEQQPRFIMSRDECNELKVTDEEEPCRYKPLEIVYHRYSDHNEKNTMIVDDRHDVCALNCMNNIRVPEFDLNDANYQTRLKDRTLDILARWIQSDEFRNNTDVRLIKSKSPFKI